MKKEERIKMIIEYAAKVVNYPPESDNYDPVDLMNLKNALMLYELENN